MKKRVSIFVLLTCILVGMMALTGNAGIVKKTINPKKWTNLIGMDSNLNPYFYKFTVKASTPILKIEAKQGSNNFVGVYDKNLKSITSVRFDRQKVRYVYLKKGTNYLGVINPQMVKISFQKVVDGKNYTFSKAKKLKKNATAVVVQSVKNNYSRYYKIKVPSTAVVNMYSESSVWPRFYDVYGNEIDLGQNYSAGECYTMTPVTPGTYYIRMPSVQYSDILSSPQVCLMRWWI